MAVRRGMSDMGRRGGEKSRSGGERGGDQDSCHTRGGGREGVRMLKEIGLSITTQALKWVMKKHYV